MLNTNLIHKLSRVNTFERWLEIADLYQGEGMADHAKWWRLCAFGFMLVADHLADGLIEMDGLAMAFLPFAERRWEVSEDGYTYTYTMDVADVTLSISRGRSILGIQSMPRRELGWKDKMWRIRHLAYRTASIVMSDPDGIMTGSFRLPKKSSDQKPKKKKNRKPKKSKKTITPEWAKYHRATKNQK